MELSPTKTQQLLRKLEELKRGAEDSELRRLIDEWIQELLVREARSIFE